MYAGACVGGVFGDAPSLTSREESILRNRSLNGSTNNSKTQGRNVTGEQAKGRYTRSKQTLAIKTETQNQKLQSMKH